MTVGTVIDRHVGAADSARSSYPATPPHQPLTAAHAGSHATGVTPAAKGEQTHEAQSESPRDTQTTQHSDVLRADPSPGPRRSARPRSGAARPSLKKEYVRSTRLTSEKRSALADQMYDVYSETVCGWTRDEFSVQVFGSGDGDEDVRVGLFYNMSGDLVGFACSHIELFEHDGKAYAVFDAGVCFRLGYRGGASAALFGLREALTFKLRHPRTPLAYLTRSHSPAVYRLIATTLPRVYPSRTRETPSCVEALVSALGERRHYAQVGKGPWVVRAGAMPINPSRLRGIEHEPDAQFYLKLNPRFAEGEALLIWTPLDAMNIAGGLWHLLTAPIGR